MRLRATLLVGLLLLWASPLFGQGCAMCYSSASASSRDGQRAITSGVVVLLLPTLGFMTVGFWLALRYGRKRDREHGESATDLESVPSTSEKGWPPLTQLSLEH